MKRFLSVFILLAMLSALLCGCTVIDKRSEPNYVEPVPQEPFVLTSETVLDGSESMLTGELLQRLETEEFVKPKNIILMIGDGMGFNSVRAAKYLNGVEGNAAMECLPIHSSATTFSTSAVTDSAAAATALATGFKTDNGMVGLTPEGDKKTNLVELAAQQGMKTGIIASTAVVDATPAGFTTHTSSRGNKTEIAAQQLENLANGKLDLILGGGLKYFTADENQQLLDRCVESGLNFTTRPSDISLISTPVLGLYANDALPRGFSATPNLAQMTDAALTALYCEKGFFLMVEGSQIDTASHANDVDEMAKEFEGFDAAVAVAMRFVAQNPDTVLVVTADHETGGISLPDGEFSYEDICYTTSGHTDTDVPVFAIGMGTHVLCGGVDNTDISKFLAAVMGNSQFGRETDKAFLKNLRSKLALNAYTLGVTANSVFSEYFGKITYNDSIIHKRIEKAAELRVLLQTELESTIPYTLHTSAVSESPIDCGFVRFDITVQPNTRIFVGQKELVTENGVFSGVLENGVDFKNRAVELTFIRGSKSETIVHPIMLKYSEYDKMVDLFSSKLYDEIAKIPPNKLSNSGSQLENGELSLFFSKTLRRFTLPASENLTGSDFTKYNGIAVTFKNDSDTAVPIPSVNIIPLSSSVATVPDTETLAAHDTTVVNYMIDIETIGINNLTDISGFTFLSDAKCDYVITDIYAIYQNEVG